MIASVLLKEPENYGRKLFIAGLQKHGFEISLDAKEHPAEQDILVLWNRLPTRDHIAKRYEQAGATVLIAENGWIGDNTYALSRSYHNGAGTWHVGLENRWPGFGIELRPWRKKGDHVLVIPQRGMGVPDIAMPQEWTANVTNRLAKITDRPIRVRYPKYRDMPLDPEFEDCHAVVIWGSGAGIKAIVHGVPVFREMVNWIGGLAAKFSIDDLENPFLGDRMPMLHRLSWAMWKPEELKSGEPFAWLLQRQ